MCISSPAPSRNVEKTVNLAGNSTIVGPQYENCFMSEKNEPTDDKSKDVYSL